MKEKKKEEKAGTLSVIVEIGIENFTREISFGMIHYLVLYSIDLVHREYKVLILLINYNKVSRCDDLVSLVSAVKYFKRPLLVYPAFWAYS
ncbi:hypothetical protein WN51_05495 [Melipona quadrifasciata]|uniref:Uncharacterized protein n=1 Tax=Melipona quadrifasciata TaxID=166423 RepID=A0A0M9AAQ3_9HYME|nr:hypothetical protein WN51_05495 [Melipona quadrifasciata]